MTQNFLFNLKPSQAWRAKIKKSQFLLLKRGRKMCEMTEQKILSQRSLASSVINNRKIQKNRTFT